MHVRRSIAAVTGATLVATVLALPATSLAQDDEGATAQVTPFRMVEDRDLEDRLPQPEDEHALASGCYTVEAPGVGWIGDGATVTAAEADAAPFHFQATDLATYLLAYNAGPDTSVEGAWWDERDYLATPGEVADEPSVEAEWSVVPTDPSEKRKVGRTYLLRTQDGEALTFGATAVSTSADGTPVRFHHVQDDDKRDADPNGTACATWPEIQTNTSGEPAPTGKGAGDRVEGFFEAHIHGMAYEFLGGDLRCGQPWHRYGVEHALPDCQEDGKPLNATLEVGLAGQDPQDPFTEYDPVGWPTFGYWPKHDTLTHEQFYWKWLERAHHGGLRIFTNLFVENTALCQLYPQKKNSCNEMDSVRLQARRIHELQDYIDAQNGGPGEGWFRIVTDPSQARRVINDGRLAVVLGIEISELFDCREILDVPQCTAEQIDDRLAEAYDMGVRQMELLNKFDSALAGVTGDGGSTGIVVNQGNRMVTQHYWNMVTCDEVESEYEGHQHDKTQLNLVDETFGGNNDEIDVLAGVILNQFAPAGGVGAPAYPPAPHCNTRGLTDLGRHVIRGMVERGMIFDPDHMSALAQRQALDFIEDELIPAELAAAEAEGRSPVQPSLISSHSWGNDVIYQRIFALDGHVAPRTTSADGFVERWQQRREWFDELAPQGAMFGMGYGADTNGLGGQPGPRSNPAQPIDYADGWEAPIGDVTIFQHTSGVRPYDVNTDGVAHYGLFADWFQELRLAADEKVGPGAGDAIITDMLNGAEDYLRMWERNVYGANECVENQAFLQAEDVHALVGRNFDEFQTAIGAPASRDGEVYTYCTESGTVLDVVLDAAGNVIEVVESNSGLTLQPAEETAPAPGEDTDPAGAPGDGHTDHEHALPATGGGATAVAGLLFGLSGLGWSGLRRGRGD